MQELAKPAKFLLISALVVLATMSFGEMISPKKLPDIYYEYIPFSLMSNWKISLFFTLMPLFIVYMMITNHKK